MKVTYEAMRSSELFARLIGAALRDTSTTTMRALIDTGLTSAEIESPHVSALWGVAKEQFKHTERVDTTLIEDALAELLDPDLQRAAVYARDTVTMCLDAAPIRGPHELPGLLDHARKRVALRRLAKAGDKLSKASADPFGDPVKIIDRLRAEADAIAASTTVLKAANGAELAAMALQMIEHGEPEGDRCPTGFPQIDATTEGGMQRGLPTVLGAGMGVGKTTFAGHMVLTALEAGRRVLWLSFEAPARDVTKALTQMKARRRIPKRADEGTHELRSDLYGAAGWLGAQPIWVLKSGGMTVEQVIATVRAYKQLQDVDYVVVDYVQDIERTMPLLPRDDLNYAHISKRLRDLAETEHLFLLETSQLGEIKEKRKPTKDDTAYTKQIGKDAALVVMVDRDFAAKDARMRDVSMLMLVKNRYNGRLVEEWMRYSHDEGGILIPCSGEGGPVATVNVYAPPTYYAGDAWDGADA